MALSCSLSHSAPPTRLLCTAGIDMFENWFSATLSNLVIIYTNCFWRNKSILNRHSCHYEENGEVWVRCECYLTWTAHVGVLLSVTSSSCTMKWKISLFTPPFPPHFFASCHHCYLENNSSSHEALTEKSEGYICLQASGKSSCGHRPLHENYSVGVCQHETLQTDRDTLSTF